MEKDARVESKNQTFTAPETEALGEPAAVCEVTGNGIWRTRIGGQARELSRSNSTLSRSRSGERMAR